MLALGMLLVLIGVTLFVFALYSSPVAKVRADRRLAPGAIQRTPLEDLVSRLDGLVDSQLRQRGWNPFPAEKLELAGVRTPQSTIVTTILAGAATVIMIGGLLGGPLLAVLFAPVVPVGALIVINGKRDKRRAAFAEQLEGTLEVMTSALRAGHSFPSALDTVAVDALDPTDEEFARIINEGRIGRDLVAAMRTTATRMESQDFEWIADAVSVQRDTGGNLSEVLTRVAETIRERSELAKKVRALAAEGRASAWVMLLMPPVLGTYLAVVNPKSFGDAFLTVTGITLLLGCAVLYAIGIVWIRKIVDVKV